LGQKNANSIILNEAYWYDNPGFPRKSFCQQLARTKELENNLYHAKFFIVTNKDSSDVIDDDTVLYFGSHNLSGGAWGNLEKDGHQIAISNWEIGVVFPPRKGSKEMKEKIVKHQLVLKFPPEKYGQTDYPFFMRSLI
jgi:tyrosyl-DNA phosphodiesterase-1